MAEKSYPPYECTLSTELMKKAEDELNEKPEWRSRDIQALRDMVLKQKDLHVRTDDAFLLRFLRAKKFDYDRAFNLLMTHYKMKQNNQELFSNLRPSAVKHVLEAGVTGVLPNRDKQGRKVIIFRPVIDNILHGLKHLKDLDSARDQFWIPKILGNSKVSLQADWILMMDIYEIEGLWDPGRYPIDDVFRTNFMTMSKIVQDEATQVNGVLMCMDLQGVGFSHAKNISPFYAKRVMSLIQDAFPLRFKGLHYLNEPAIFNYIFSIVKPFMKEKTRERLHFHGNKYEELEDYIDPEYLPEDYGGKAPKFCNTDWKDLLLECDGEFDEEAKYGLVDGVAQSSKTNEDAMECLTGTYRKLNVD